jgi:general secretion pathway protein N
MRVRTLVAIGIAAYVAFLAATAPASVVASRVAAATGGALRVESASGTIWNGSAHAILDGPAGRLAVDDIEWHWLPLRLASARLAFEVRAAMAGLTASAEAGRTLGAWQLRDLKAQGDVAALAALSPLAARWRPEGSIALSAPALSWSADGDLRGDLAAQWNGAALALSDVRPLGSYRVELRGAGGPAALAVRTVDGALRIEGRGTVSASGVTFSGEARADGAQAQRLAALLDLMGPRRPDGARTLEWRTN